MRVTKRAIREFLQAVNRSSKKMWMFMIEEIAKIDDGNIRISYPPKGF